MGKFIVFEGIEGVGKSTQLELLSQYFAESGISHISTREPGGTPLAEQIRNVFLAKEEVEKVSAWTELLLVFAARAQHLTEKIYPALEKGQWVLCDRFTDASYAYQGRGRGLGCDRVSALEALVQGEFRPDQVILLDMPVMQALQRVESRMDKQDRMDSQSVEFYKKVQSGYQERAVENPDRYLIVGAEGSPEATHEKIRSEIKHRFTDWFVSHAL